MQSLEQAYKLARVIRRSVNQVESEPAMSAEEALNVLRSLWKYESARIVEDELQLIYIYDKADYDNISDTYLRDILKRMG